MEGDFELRHILFYGGCGFTIMRCMSFALENCERKDGNYNILELLKYNFYLPFFYFGPIMTFDKFYVQVSSNIPGLDSGAQALLAGEFSYLFIYKVGYC